MQKLLNLYMNKKYSSIFFFLSPIVKRVKPEILSLNGNKLKKIISFKDIIKYTNKRLYEIWQVNLIY